MSEETKELDFESFRVTPEVLETIAGVAAGSVDGIFGLVGASGARGTPGRRSLTRGVSVATEDGRLDVAVHLAVRFGEPMRGLAQQIQNAVSDALCNMTGWPVASVEVYIDEVEFEDQG